MTDWISSLMQRPARHPALRTARGNLSYGELLRGAAGAQQQWSQRGRRAGEHVLLALTDERHLLCLMLGAWSAGLVVMIADPGLPAAAIADLIRRYEPDDIAADAALIADWGLSSGGWQVPAESALREGALLRRLLGRRAEPAAGLLATLDACTGSEPPALAYPSAETALIFFTSGSTALPKAVELGHAALGAHLATLSRHHGYGTDSRLLNALPLHHADGLVQGPLVALFNGATLCRTEPFDVPNIPRFLDTVYRDGITHMVAVPTMLALMLRLGASQADSFASPDFRHVISTAGHLDEAMWRQFEQHFGVRVCNTYGLTETVAGGIFCGPGDATRKLGTLGKPIDCEVRLIDAEGRDVVDGSRGELLLRGPNLMLGYHRNSQATAQVLRAGWLHTGDLAWRDGEGFLHFAGRLKNIIVCGGYNVHPEEVDEVLAAHPAVQAAATFGLPHPDWEETVVSAVVWAPGSVSTEQDLLAHCRAHLTAYKVPRRLVFLDALPYGPSGKVRLEALKARCAEATGATSTSSTSIEAEVMQVARQIFHAHPGPLGPLSGPDNTLGWDSLAHIEFVSALERLFALRLSEQDIVALTHLGRAADIIATARQRG